MTAHRFYRSMFVAALLSVSASAASFIPPASGYSVNVKDLGAKGDGITDDTPAIQSAISLAESHGGGVVVVPAGTYYLNSYSPSVHPWYFYNLRIGSNVLLQGAPGTRFLQGPGGRAPLQKGAPEVRNTVIAVGTPYYVVVTFQNPAYNGGFLSLHPTAAGTASLTLSSPSQASYFAAGDYVAIYSSTSGDVIPTETSQVTAVNYSAGTLSLQWPLARSFQTPSIAKVTSLATSNVGISNVVVQGTEPLAVTETFNFTAQNCQFISDLSVGGANTYGLNLNTLRDFRFSADQVSSVGPGYVPIQLPQRNSQTGVIEASTFTVQNLVFGEYAANWNLTGNNIMLYPGPNDSAMLALGGLNVTFANNTVTGAGAIPLLVDYLGSNSYAAYVGNISVTGNTISCRADNSNCMEFGSPSAVVMNNQLVAQGNAVGIKVEGPVPQTASISQNTLTMQGGLGVVLNTMQVDQSSVIDNTIKGSGAIGVVVATPASPNSGADLIAGNCISGFGTAVSVNMSIHPGTLVSNSASACLTASRPITVQGVNTGILGQ